MTSLNPHDLVRPDATIRYWTGGAPAARRSSCCTAPRWITGRGPRRSKPCRTVSGSWSPTCEPTARPPGASTSRLLSTTSRPARRASRRRVVLVGLSLGGNLAQEVVRRAPERVAAIVVADATCNTGARHPLAASMTVAALNAHAMCPAIISPGTPPSDRLIARSSGTPLTPTCTAEPGDRPHPDLAAHRRAAARAGLLAAGARTAGPRPTRPLGDIALSTRAWAQREPLAEYVVIPAAGHASNLDNPAAFTAALLAFLDRVLGPGGEEEAQRRQARRGTAPLNGSTPCSRGCRRRGHAGRTAADGAGPARSGAVSRRTGGGPIFC